MPQNSKNIWTVFRGQINPELFRFKIRSLFLGHPVRYLKVLEGQISLSTLSCTPRVCVNSSFFGYLIVLKNPRFKSCNRIYTTHFSRFLKIKTLDMFDGTKLQLS